MSKWKNMKITTFKQRTISLSCLDESEQLIAWPARVKNRPSTTSIFSSPCIYTPDGDYAKSGTGNFRQKDGNILIFMISWILRCVFIDHILWLLYFFDVFTLLTLFIAILQLTQFYACVIGTLGFEGTPYYEEQFFQKRTKYFYTFYVAKYLEVLYLQK